MSHQAEKALDEILEQKQAGEGYEWVTEKKIRMMFNYFSMVDADGGGEIDRDEFSQIMHDPLFMGADVSQVRGHVGGGHVVCTCAWCCTHPCFPPLVTQGPLPLGWRYCSTRAVV
jgi:hypothetical protein